MDIINCIEELKGKKPIEYNIENFYAKSDDDRYKTYLNDHVLKNVKNDNLLNSTIVVHSELARENVGVYLNKNNTLTCVIPERKTLYDEMVCIHEITHLINAQASLENVKTIAKEVIPYFNEYDYLNAIHSFYSNYYLAFRVGQIVKSLNKVNINNLEDLLANIYAYYTLKNNILDYNINELNKINATTNNLERKLTKSGYTI